MAINKQRVVKEISSWGGALGLLLGYAAVSLEFYGPKDAVPAILNLIGSAGFVVLNYTFRAWPPVIVNLFWFAMGMYNLLR
jgi:hypothetical protein